jgi:hypothetical protein
MREVVMTREEFSDSPPSLRALLTFSAATTVVVFGALGCAVVGLSAVHRTLAPFMGLVSAYPYLWISGVVAPSVWRGHRKPGLRFARLVLLVAVVTGLADLAMNGWSWGTPGESLYSSPWRLAWAWIPPLGWLVLLGSKRVREWEKGGATEAPTPGYKKGIAIGVALAVALAGIAGAAALIRSSRLKACDTVMRVVVEARFRPEDVTKAVGASSHKTYLQDQTEELLRVAAGWDSKREFVRVRAGASSSTQVLLANDMVYVVFYDASGRAKDYVCVGK